MDIHMDAIDEERYEGLLVLEPRETFDDCILGIVQRFHDRFVLYSRKCVIEKLMDETDEEPHLSAIEHFEYNIVGGWVGDTTPGLLEDDET